MSWPVVKIGDVCSLMTGGTPKTSVVEYYEGGTVPWIVSGDIHKQEIFDCEKRVTELAVENSNTRYLPKDSVLIALNGQGKTRGTVALLRIQGATCNQSIVSINPNNKEDLFCDYLFFYLKSQYQQIRNITGDKDRAGLNMPLIREIEIPLPPLPEQKRIAAILDKADAIRRKRQQAIQLADEFLRSVFLDMFGDPVTNPKGWQINKAGDVCDCIVPGRDKPKSFTGDIPWITTNELCHLGVTYKSKDFSGLTETEIAEVRAKIVPKDAVIMTCVGDLGVVSIAGEDMVINQQLHAFLPHKRINPVFIAYALSFQKGYMVKMASNTTVPYMNKAVCNSVPLIMPPLSLQNKFNDFVTQTVFLKDRFAEFRATTLFESLSQRAFSGQLDKETIYETQVSQTHQFSRLSGNNGHTDR